MNNQYKVAMAQFAAMEKDVAEKGIIHRDLKVKLRGMRMDAAVFENVSAADIAVVQAQTIAADEVWMEAVRASARASYFIAALHGLMLMESDPAVEKEEYLVETYRGLKDYIIQVTSNLHTLDELALAKSNPKSMVIIDLGNIFMPRMKESLVAKAA